MFGRRRSGFVPGRATLWWFVTAVAIGLIGWSKAINLLMILGFVLLGLLICHGMAARLMARRVRLNPDAGTTVFAGETAPIVFQLTNLSPHPATFRVDGPRTLSWHYQQLASRETVRGVGHTMLSERGKRLLGRFAVVSSYPFGVLEYRQESAEVPEIHVLPAIGTINERQFRHWLRVACPGDSHELRATTRRWNADGDVRGIRSYRTGDNPKDVHWKSTARRGTLHVREYDSTPPKDLIILVEAYAPDRDAIFPPLEEALSLAATLAWEWAHWDGNSTARVVVLGSNERVMRVTPGNPASLRDLADVSGTTEVVGQTWLRHAKILRQGHRVFVSSRTGSTLPVQLSETGYPVLAVEHDPTWYRPPQFSSESN